MRLYLLQLGFLQPLGVPVPGYVLRTKDGENILVDSGFPGNDEDEMNTRSSTRKLVEIARRAHVVLIIHGHDHKQWPTLKHAPEWYG